MILEAKHPKPVARLEQGWHEAFPANSELFFALSFDGQGSEPSILRANDENTDREIELPESLKVIAGAADLDFRRHMPRDEK